MARAAAQGQDGSTVRLAAKLTFVTVLAVLAAFAARGYQSVRRQVAITAHDRAEDAWLIGRALRPALVELWRTEGPSRAEEVLRYANERIGVVLPVSIKLLPLDSSAPATTVVPPEHRRALTSGSEVTVNDTVHGRTMLYLPFAVNGAIPAAIEISTALGNEDGALRAEVVAIVQRTLLAAVIAIVSVTVLGFVVVGRPMRLLVQKARRIGNGDLSGPLDLRQRDEVGELAREMNEMCVRLKSAQRDLEGEVAQRIATSEQLRHADRLTTVGTLASGLAHELGTPLNVVSGRAKMIARGQLSGAAINENAQTIIEQSERMTKIIRQLMGFASRRRPQKISENLHVIAVRTLGMLRPLAHRSNVTFDSVQNNNPAFAEVDAGLIEQALTNLVVNGIQAMPAGGVLSLASGTNRTTPPPEHGGSESEYAYLRVQDQGVGIPLEQQRRVFEPFFTTKDVGEGTGLGLSVSYGIIRDHGGWIAVSSEVGSGSCFTIQLPAVHPDQRHT